ncbi:TetR family transcriptional regulator [Nonomuraea longispora]|uniref:TetR family transcriptional regulator n=1 Tax=Nonomuraea longispora TaxID=1848320 RepID=A0A4R4NAZ1_9ACTN|nr:TetR/AcrR family transcriptional regulator [Nonomuraea longispora]TDC04573.1 TetR family transcriptional regulator [Nonomuraea longispora]
MGGEQTGHGVTGREWRVRGRPRGRPPRITRPAIADAALAVGFDNLTLATVADRLQVAHSALYRHVADREELVMVAIDRAVAAAPWPEPAGEWRPDLEAQAAAVWRVLERHPGLVKEFLRLTRFPEEVMRRFGASVRSLIGYGFTAENAFLAVDTVFDLTIDVFSRGKQLDAPTGRGIVRDNTADAWAEAVGAEVAPIMRRALTDPAATWFDRKLELVLDGVAASLAPRSG